MSDATFFLWFLVLPILYALWWILRDRLHALSAAAFWAFILLAGMLVLLIRMVAELRSGAPPP